VSFRSPASDRVSKMFLLLNSVNTKTRLFEPHIMSVNYFNASHLDASAAVKLVWEEPGSDHLRKYFSDRGGFHITSLCLEESLGALKRKWLKGELSDEQYFGCCYLLLAYLRSPPRMHLDEIHLSSLDTFSKAEEIARRHKLDLSDSLQLVSVKYGKFSRLVHQSKTVLITANCALASAAKAEGLRIWNCAEEAMPPPK
jgi:predicted nucleic acid-binding protein